MAISNNASAIFTINPPSDSIITSSTFGNSSFVITNNSENGQKINKVVIDLSSAIFKDIVFDPNGTAGDPASKPFSVNALGNTGQTSFSYISAHDGGFFGLEISFDDFQPNETFKFSIDIDPTSIKGTSAPGPEHAGSVSGLELVGSTITVDFDDDTSAIGQPYYISDSNDASTTVIQAELPEAPSLEIIGVSSESVTGTAAQTVRITGVAGETVSLLTTEGALFTQEGVAGFDIDAFEANSAVAINEQTATIGDEGYVDISIALTRTDVSSGEAGLNILTAIVKGEDGVNSLISNVAVVEYDPTVIDSVDSVESVEPANGVETSAIRINAGGDTYTDKQGNIWNADTYFNGGRVFTRTSEIANSVDDALYQSERYLGADGNLSYDIPVENGEYQVTLKFAEIFFNDSGKRVFDASAEGETVVDNLDLVAESGSNVAIDKTFNVTVTDGVLDLDFASEVENAKISAIQIVPISPTVDPVAPVEPVNPVAPVEPVNPVAPVDPIAPTNLSTVRINAGGDTFTDAEGNVWSADTHSNGGRVFTRTSEIAGTNDDSLYQSERFLGADGNLSYDIPVENGEYQVTLKFAEIFFNDSGKRVFDASAEGETVVDNLDLVAQAGSNVAVDKTFNVTVTDGVLDLDFASEVENAKISAIEIVPAATVVAPVEPVQPVDSVDSVETNSVRINTGGGDYVDPSNNLWIADQYFNGGNTHGTTDAIVATDLDPIYQSERWANNLSYDVPVENGLYSVNLHFAEIYHNAPQTRSFDISLEGEQVLDNLDIYASTKNAFDPGHDKAYVASFAPIQVTDGVLDLDLSASIDNAKISGIEIIPLSGAQVVVQETQGSTIVNENGSGDTYTLTLTQQPISNVVVNLDSNNLLNTNQSQVIFTPQNWSTSQTITVNAVNNNQATGTQFTSIVHSVSSVDTNYDGLEIADISVRVNDDDVVPVKFNQKTIASDITPSPFTGVTVGAWGPDNRLYVGSYSGMIKAYTFDDNYNVTDTETINTLVGESNPNILGIAFNPFDSSDNPQIYVSHSQLYANNNGKAFPSTELSSYSGQISVLGGNDFSTINPLITGLPVSNHDHGVNDIIFDNQGDLLVAVGGNTNAGIKNGKIGGIPESPFSAAVLKAEISKPDFNGNIEYQLATEINPSDYDLPADFNPDTDLDFDPASSQVFGDIVEVVPGVDVSVYASGLRNAFSLLLTTDDLVYAVENGANGGFGDKSVTATTQVPFPDQRHQDELNLLEEDGYYGFANRSYGRGATDDRQNTYYGPDEASQNGYTAPLQSYDRGSTNGLAEYRANSFGGQLKGDILAQQLNFQVNFTSLNEDGTEVVNSQNIGGVADGLDIFTAPRGAVIGVDFFEDKLTVALPDDASIGDDATALDIFPWRAPANSENSFVIGGDNFGDLNNTTVTIGGEVAQVTSVSDGFIRGTLPSFASPSGELLDVVVESAGQTSVLDDAFLAL